MTVGITQVEIGAMRALSVAFGKKNTKLPDLPDYEDVIGGGSAKADKPAWMTRYEQVNRDRLASVDDRGDDGRKDAGSAV